MKTIDLIQGSPEWAAHRAQHFNASDAPAMLDCSPYMTRDQLLRRLHTGIAPDVDAATQRRFDDGHRYEALARPLAEEIIGEELYAVTGTNGNLSASFDGLTMLENTAFEHKTLNESLRYTPWDEGNGYHLPMHYQVQMEHQLMVSGAERVLFMATKWDGETLAEERHCWYASDPALRARIAAGWKQFAVDLAAYTPTVQEIKPVGRTPESLPALRASVTGELVLEANIKEWEAAALKYIQAVRSHELETDQDFEDADAAAKWCDSSKATLTGLKASLMSATGDVNTAVGMLERIIGELDKTRIQFTKAITTRKSERKAEIVAGGVAAFAKHVAELNASMPADYMPKIATDFGGCIKNLRSFASIQNAVNSELARAKIAADEVAARIRKNVDTIKASGLLVTDTSTLVLKAPDDLAAVLAQRKAEQDARDAALLAQEQARLESDAMAKLAATTAEAKPAQVEPQQRTLDQAEDAAIVAAPAAHQERDPDMDGMATPRPALTYLSSGIGRVTPAANDQPKDHGVRIKLGDLQAKLAPISINAEGLTALGFPPAMTDKNAKLYRECDFPAICAAIARHANAVAAEHLLAA